MAKNVWIDSVYGEQPYPLVSLRVVCCDLRVQVNRHAIQGDAIVGSYDKLLLQPELFLKVLQLSDKIYNLVRDFPKDFDSREVLVDFGCQGTLNVVEVHHFVLDIEV